MLNHPSPLTLVTPRHTGILLFSWHSSESSFLRGLVTCLVVPIPFKTKFFESRHLECLHSSSVRAVSEQEVDKYLNKEVNKNYVLSTYIHLFP